MLRYKKLLPIFSFVFLIFLDQFSKYIVRHLPVGEGGFYICNANLAFGLSPFKIFFLLLGIFTIMILFNFKSIFNFKILTLFGNLKLKIENFSIVEFLSVLMILSGAISNIIDRLVFGCVIDFIDLKFWPASNAMGVALAGWPVFNLADIFITAGVILIIFHNFKPNKLKS